ncbi:MAG TPA: glycosyltransferase family 4 protein [Bacteroidetes bacterium]|nr:glycosyltransferase family 4 protein [Bacteroidota bacterium]
MTFNGLEEDFYTLQPDVKRINIKQNILFNNSIGTFIYWNLAAYSLSKILTKYDINNVISFLVPANFVNIISNFYLKHSTIISERNNPEIYKLSKIGEIARRFLYKYSDFLVVQTEKVKKWAISFLDIEKVIVIANPVNIEKESINAEDRVIKDEYIISVGRLDYNKGIDVLIKSFAKINSKFPNIKLVIVGEGELKSQLKELTKDIGIEKSVIFYGYSNSPFELIKKAKFFVLSSRTEGFPNVILEAMALGKAVISTDCPNGPSEIIQNGLNGILVPVDDVDKLGTAMLSLIEDEKLTLKLAQKAKEINDKYSIEKIMRKWRELIK